MKVNIWIDSAYPVYGISTNHTAHNRTIEVADEFLAEYLAVESAYQAMQDKLEALEDKQAGRVPPPPPEPKLTQAEIDAIKATTPVEPPEAIEAAVAAVNARTKAA